LTLIFGSVAGVAQGRKILDPIVTALPPADDVVRFLGPAATMLGVRLPKNRSPLASAIASQKQICLSQFPIIAA
jgi:hypothetical protein